LSETPPEPRAAAEPAVLAGVVLVLAGGGVLLYLLAPILTPFLVSALLAYVWDPVIDRLEAWRLPRSAGIALVYLLLVVLLLGILLVLAPMLQAQVQAFLGKLPAYLAWLNDTVLPWLGRHVLTPEAVAGASLDLQGVAERLLGQWRDVGGLLGQVTAAVTRSGVTVALWIANLILVPVVTFYLLRDWDDIVARVHALLPRRVQGTAAQLARETDRVLSHFFRGQLLVMLVLGTVYSLGLWWVGLDLALPIGLLAGLVSFVPYLGVIVGVLSAALAAALQFQHLLPVLWVGAVFAAGQVLEGWFLTPRLVGSRVGLHPVAVIFAVMAGGQLFGFFGVLLAIPAAAAVMVWLRHLHGRYRASGLYHG